MANYPKYDNDTATKGYVDDQLKKENKGTEEKIKILPRSFSAPPTPPYYKDSLLAYNNKIYKCINDRDIGEFNWNDWAVVATDDTSLNNFVTNTYTPEMELKANDADLTGGELIIRINADTTQALLNANKINLTASDVINILAGNSINLTSKNITIDSTNFGVDASGAIRAISGIIGGFTLGQHLFTANLHLNKTYTASDKTRLQGIILGNITPTAEDYDKYDLTKSGSFNIIDLLIVTKLADGYETGNGVFNINTEQSKDAITLVRDNKVAVNIGIFGAYFSSLKADNFYASSIKAGGIKTSNLESDNIDFGDCTLDSNSADVTVYFNKTFASAPKVVITPNTTVSGVIAPKVKSITTTYFTATIGGNIGQFSNVNCSWIAIG